MRTPLLFDNIFTRRSVTDVISYGMVYFKLCGGESHEDCACEQKHIELGSIRTTRRATAAAHMADEVEIAERLMELSLSEREKRAQEEIEEVERIVRVRRLEERVLELRAEQERQLERGRRLQYGGVSEERERPLDHRRGPNQEGEWGEFTTNKDEHHSVQMRAGDSDYGQSRRRSREPRSARRRSRSDSSSSW